MSAEFAHNRLACHRSGLQDRCGQGGDGLSMPKPQLCRRKGTTQSGADLKLVFLGGGGEWGCSRSSLFYFKMHKVTHTRGANYPIMRIQMRVGVDAIDTLHLRNFRPMQLGGHADPAPPSKSGLIYRPDNRLGRFPSKEPKEPPEEACCGPVLRWLV